jgi:lysophospholipase L1-like esterase
MTLPVQAPARYVPLTALSFGAPGSDAAAVSATTPLPVTRGATFEEILMREGEPFALIANNAAAAVATTTGAVNTAIVSSAAPPMTGMIFYVETARYSLDQAAATQFGISPDAAGRLAGIYDQQIVAANQIVQVPIRQFLRQTEFQNGIATLSVRNNLTGGAVSYRGAVAMTGRVIADDLNFAAAHPILVAGDSISRGTGPSRTANMYQVILRDWLNTQGFDCRLILKAKSGSNSSEHETYRQAGWHRPASRPRLRLYALGTNDAAQGVSAATYVANVTGYWTWWSATYPGTPLVVIGIPPMQNAGYQASAVTLRAAAAAYVASVGSPSLCFVDLGNAFAATDATKTADGVHPNDAGSALLGAAMIAGFQARGITPA